MIANVLKTLNNNVPTPKEKHSRNILKTCKTSRHMERTFYLSLKTSSEHCRNQLEMLGEHTSNNSWSLSFMRSIVG